ncbi:MAG: Ig-like domain-containing protein [Flavobacteriaceae bacterium]
MMIAIKHFKYCCYFLVVGLLLIGCARRGSPTGGPLDSIPPVLINASPKMRSVNFKSDKIVLTFDEFVKFKDLDKQLVISPPLEKKAYTIRPQTGASKKVTIEFLDSLQALTTYTINFGEAINDHNEGNILPFFSYTFSTGDEIDSLGLGGKISDGLLEVSEEYVTLQMYPLVDSIPRDSMPYLIKPFYVTSTLDSIFFEFQNLREGTYEVIALKDLNFNYIFDPASEKIGFLKDPIRLPTDSVLHFRMFKEVLAFQWARPFYINHNKIGIGYFGGFEKRPIEILSSVPEGFRYLTNRDRKTDTLNFWITEHEGLDSLQLGLAVADSLQKFTVKFRQKTADSLVVSPLQKGKLNLRDTLILNMNRPVVQLDSTHFRLVNVDTLPVPFRVRLDENHDRLYVDFEKIPNDRYSLSMTPQALTDFWGSTNDSLQWNWRTQKTDAYGNIIVRMPWEFDCPFILQLLDGKGLKVIREVSEEDPFGTYTFDYLLPGKYRVRVIEDCNANGRWDTGNYLQKIQPERRSYYPPELELRANWDLNEQFNPFQNDPDPEEMATAPATAEEKQLKASQNTNLPQFR